MKSIRQVKSYTFSWKSSESSVDYYEIFMSLDKSDDVNNKITAFMVLIGNQNIPSSQLIEKLESFKIQGLTFTDDITHQNYGYTPDMYKQHKPVSYNKFWVRMDSLNPLTMLFQSMYKFSQINWNDYHNLDNLIKDFSNSLNSTHNAIPYVHFS